MVLTKGQPKRSLQAEKPGDEFLPSISPIFLGLSFAVDQRYQRNTALSSLAHPLAGLVQLTDIEEAVTKAILLKDDWCSFDRICEHVYKHWGKPKRRTIADTKKAVRAALLGKSRDEQLFVGKVDEDGTLLYALCNTLVSKSRPEGSEDESNSQRPRPRKGGAEADAADAAGAAEADGGSEGDERADEGPPSRRPPSRRTRRTGGAASEEDGTCSRGSAGTADGGVLTPRLAATAVVRAAQASDNEDSSGGEDDGRQSRGPRLTDLQMLMCQAILENGGAAPLDRIHEHVAKNWRNIRQSNSFSASDSRKAVAASLASSTSIVQRQGDRNPLYVVTPYALALLKKREEEDSGRADSGPVAAPADVPPPAAGAAATPGGKARSAPSTPAGAVPAVAAVKAEMPPGEAEDMHVLIARALASNGGAATFDQIVDYVSRYWGAHKRDHAGTPAATDVKRAISMVFHSNDPTATALFKRDATRRALWTLTPQAYEFLGAQISDEPAQASAAPPPSAAAAAAAAPPTPKTGFGTPSAPATPATPAGPVRDMQALVVDALQAHGGSGNFERIFEYVQQHWTQARRRDGSLYQSDMRRAVHTALARGPFRRDARDDTLWHYEAGSDPHSGSPSGAEDTDDENEGEAVSRRQARARPQPSSRRLRSQHSDDSGSERRPPSRRPRAAPGTDSERDAADPAAGEAGDEAGATAGDAQAAAAAEGSESLIGKRVRADDADGSDRSDAEAAEGAGAASSRKRRAAAAGTPSATPATRPGSDARPQRTGLRRGGPDSTPTGTPSTPAAGAPLTPSSASASVALATAPGTLTPAASAASAAPSLGTTSTPAPGPNAAPSPPNGPVQVGGVVLTPLQELLCRAIIDKGGACSFDALLSYVTPMWSTLRKPDGSAYTSDLKRSLLASLSHPAHGYALFRKEGDMFMLADKKVEEAIRKADAARLAHKRSHDSASPSSTATPSGSAGGAAAATPTSAAAGTTGPAPDSAGTDGGRSKRRK